jgi:hypothetical protein
MVSCLVYLVVLAQTFSTYVCAAPLGLTPRAVIAHDAIVGFPQTVPSGIEGTLMLKYKPWLEVYNGCVPFPAVNAAGDTGCVPNSPAQFPLPVR